MTDWQFFSAVGLIGLVVGIAGLGIAGALSRVGRKLHAVAEAHRRIASNLNDLCDR